MDMWCCFILLKGPIIAKGFISIFQCYWKHFLNLLGMIYGILFKNHTCQS